MIERPFWEKDRPVIMPGRYVARPIGGTKIFGPTGKIVRGKPDPTYDTKPIRLPAEIVGPRGEHLAGEDPLVSSFFRVEPEVLGANGKPARARRSP